MFIIMNFYQYHFRQVSYTTLNYLHSFQTHFFTQSTIIFALFIQAACPRSHAEYTYGHLEICLRFVPDQQKYPMGTSVCQQDGGDLIKLDSQRKFENFQHFLGSLYMYERLVKKLSMLQKKRLQTYIIIFIINIKIYTVSTSDLLVQK